MINGRPATPGQEVVINQSLPVKELFRARYAGCRHGFFYFKSSCFFPYFCRLPFSDRSFYAGMYNNNGSSSLAGHYKINAAWRYRILLNMCIPMELMK
jgi:hypothetical protein